MPKAVILDANALLMPFQFKLNLDSELRRLFGEVSVFVPSSVLGELANSTDKNSKAALALARKYGIAETDLRGDDAVLDLAVKRDAVVVTNDKELISRLKARRLHAVRLRSRKYLVIDES